MNLDFVVYHDRMSDYAKTENERRFADEEGAIMIVTTALRQGMDYERLTLMIIPDGCYNFLELLQQSGRLGRQEQGGRSVLYVSEYFVNKLQTDTRIDRRALLCFITIMQCRLTVVGNHLDQATIGCDPHHACDNCERIAPLSTYQQASSYQSPHSLASSLSILVKIDSERTC